MSNQASLGDIKEPDEEKLTENPELIKGVAWSKIEGFPDDWNANTLEGDLDLQTGNNFPSENFVDEGGLPLIRIRDLPTGEPETNYKGEYDDKYLIEPEDLLVGMDGEFKPYLWSGEKALLNQRVLKIESEKYNRYFLRYSLEKPLRYIQKSISGTTVKHLSQKNIKKINLPTPGISEQRRIASVLYNVDQAIQKTEEMIEQTQRVKKGLMQDLFTEGYFEHEETKNTPIGEVPESWRLKNISEIGKIINGSTFPEEEQGKSEGVPFIKVSDTNKTDKYASYAENFITRERADELNVRILPENSVILPKRGAAILTNKRRLLSQDSAIDNNQIGVYTEDISNDYLFHYLCTVDMERYAQKGAVHSLNKSTLAKIKIPVPEQDEQKKIAKSLNSLDAEIYQLKEERDRLQRFKKGLMQDLLTGEVRTSESVEVLDEVREVES